MLYMPASTLATPIVLQKTPTIPLASTPHYYMAQPPALLPTVPFLNTAFAYPNYAFVTAPVGKDTTDKSHTQEAAKSVQHVVHHCTTPCSVKTCPCYCELCYPREDHSHKRHTRSHSHSSSRSRSRSRSRSPPRHEEHHRQSRREEFDQSRHHEAIDEKIERLRRELAASSVSKHHKSTETIDYYHPPRSSSPPTVEHRVHYKQHYDAPKPRPRSRSRSRSASSRRASSLPREPWRSSNQNDYPWRDAHLPAYREATLSRSQTPVDDSRVWMENAHKRSHQNTQNSASYYNRKDYVYRPRSETEARKWYTQSTGRNADQEVYQALHGETRTYNYKTPSTSYYGPPVRSTRDHLFYSDVPSVSTNMHRLNRIDSTQHHNLYGCNEQCLHIVPKQGGTLDPPYLKILNAPVTYVH